MQRRANLDLKIADLDMIFELNFRMYAKVVNLFPAYVILKQRQVCILRSLEHDLLRESQSRERDAKPPDMMRNISCENGFLVKCFFSRATFKQYPGALERHSGGLPGLPALTFHM